MTATHPAFAGPAGSLPRAVLAPELQRIVQALAGRLRYRYVQPWVQAAPACEGGGWRILSPNCSRRIDPTGGHIHIAWLQPSQHGAKTPTLWQVHAHDHTRRQWVPVATALHLDDALQRICQDPLGRFWP